MKSTYLRNAELGTLDAVSYSVATLYASLHSGHPGITGANEITGGAGPYARQLVDPTTPAGGTTANTSAVTFTGLPAVGAPGLVFAGLWDAVTAGNFLWSVPLGAQLAAPFVGQNTGDVLTAYAHGLNNGDIVDVVDIFDGVIPAGLAVSTIYYVVNKTTDTFQLAATSGGSAIVLTGDGGGMFRRVTPKLVNAGDSATFAIGALTLSPI